MTAKPPPNSKRTASASASARPPANPHAEAWIRQGDADALGKGDLYTARLTLDITPAMRARIKVSAFTQGVTVADLLRGLLEREFPNTAGEHTMTASASPAAGAATAARSPAGQPASAPLTRVALAYIEPRFKLYLRFGEPARTLQLDRWRRCAVFLPGAMFCRIRWQANDYGTIRWQLMVMQACTPLDAAQRIPGVQPGAPAAARRRREPVRAVLERIDAIEALGIAPIAVSPAYWRTLANRLAARLPLPEYTAERHAAWLAGRALP
jgi:hypothetical protein